MNLADQLREILGLSQISKREFDKAHAIITDLLGQLGEAERERDRWLARMKTLERRLHAVTDAINPALDKERS